MASLHKQNDRIDLRISQEDKELIEAAATLKGQKMSAFVIESMRQVSQQVIETNRKISLPDESWNKFVEMLMEPAEPNASLLRAAKALKANS